MYRSELEEIVKVALANELIKVPGFESVLQAKSNLENAIAEMTVGEQGAAESRLSFEFEQQEIAVVSSRSQVVT